MCLHRYLPHCLKRLLRIIGFGTSYINIIRFLDSHCLHKCVWTTRTIEYQTTSCLISVHKRCDRWCAAQLPRQEVRTGADGIGPPRGNLRRQAEEHHRDRKPAPFPGDDSSGDRSALCQEYGNAPRACTPLETFTPILTCCHDTDIHIRFPRFPEELARTTYTQPDSSIPNTFHNTSRLPEQ